MLNKLWKILTVSSAAVSTLVMGAVVVQAAETFSVDNVALNTNWNFRRIDSQPRMSIWPRNDGDPDQQFDRLTGNLGGTLLKHRSTGNCLNAHSLWNGAEINVWPCNGSDPDQNWNLINVSDGRMLIQRRGTNLCVDTPTRDNGGKVHLWDCDSNNGNQRWRSSAYTAPPPPTGSNIIVKASTSNLNFNRGQQWVTSTNYKFIFQGDGNLVLYNPQGKAIWATGTDNTGADIFSVQADGNVVLYDRGKPVWATDTSGRPGAFLAIQTDGNVVVYASNNTPLFATGTDGGRVTTFIASADWLKKNGGSPTPPPSPIVDMVGLKKLLFRNVSSTLTSPYGMRNCQIWGNTYWNCQHPALDIAATVNSPIYSPIEGVVIARNDNYGIVGIYNQKSNKTFFFGHMNRTDVVKSQRVTKGQQVGIEGTKGHVTGPHLHFEARPGNQPYMATDIRQAINPLDAVNQANQ
ncbi:Curculin domain protein (mannose-binding) lectin [Crinalium epipsammum PCC 9333]|uniref:Curculin domain protein (Mannose-binding) lectin n=1 Tax=Crinalium epipsammum PCC 9333 TaxID=1173022 RepID=K9VUD8_9CYAN|nr:peptidoglycan DD-metalloendopeptidase family protein [Crinalium epipsammum]AFZ11546.1 Curculin domain protein (mannose-binding) lectin [Crinalium epipsammum PCC 9333]